MEKSIILNQGDSLFCRDLEKASGQNLNSCYQCGKCTAGCPIAASVEYPPHKIMRMAQLGLKKEVLSSPMIWMCLSCVTCTARCPKEVDLARVMDVLREMALKQNMGLAKKQRIALFEKLFLDSIQKHGRLYEMGTLMQYNLMALRPFQDAELLPPLWQKGKLGFSPRSIKGKREVARIFHDTLTEEY